MSNPRGNEQLGGFSNGMASLIRVGIQEQNLIQEFRPTQVAPSFRSPRALAVFHLLIRRNDKEVGRVAVRHGDDGQYTVVAADVTVYLHLQKFLFWFRSAFGECTTTTTTTRGKQSQPSLGERFGLDQVLLYIVFVIAHRDLSKYTKKISRGGLFNTVLGYDPRTSGWHGIFFLSPLPSIRVHRERTRLNHLEHRRLLSFSGEAVCFDEDFSRSCIF